MQFRTIVMALCALVLLSLGVNGIFFYKALKESAFSEALKDAAATLQEINGHISSFVSDQVKPVKIMADLKEVKEFVRDPRKENLEKANVILDQFDSSMEGSICFILDVSGTIIASSNRNGTDHLVGQNFAHLPYFQDSLKGEPGIYLSVVPEISQRAVFNSYPVTSPDGAKVIGVAVIRTTVDHFRKQILQSGQETVMVIGPGGIIFVSGDPSFRFKSLERLSPQKTAEITNSGQFGKGPFEWSGLTKQDNNTIIDQSKRLYLAYTLPVTGLEGWNLLYLKELDLVYEQVTSPFFSLGTYPVIPIGFIIVAFVIVLYRKASQDIFRRQMAEQQLEDSQRRFHDLYNRTPAMLFALDSEAKIINVNEFWLKSLGYVRDEVIGKNLGIFLTEDSRHFFAGTAMKDLRNGGQVSETPLKFVKKNGAIMHTHYSAMADQDGLGIVYRFLSVLVDITRQKQQEA